MKVFSTPTNLFNTLIMCIGLLAIFSVQSLNAEELESTRLKNTISHGTGDINVLKGQGNKTIAAATLEQLRQQNNGDLVLGVDINEAANGSEKATTQGVAIDTLTLTITTLDGVNEYTDFSTETKSLLARTSETSRQYYYTLIGRTGSNNIVGSGLNGTSFDATLRIPVDIDISTATSVQLDITLLETNGDLGDPEEFYDYSAGFEDLAVLISSDVEFLDDQAAGQSEAPLVVLTDTQTSVSSRAYYPSSDSYYLVGYEDQYPNLGDYDFNDLVVAYRVTFGLNDALEVLTVSGEGYLVARGGSHDHDWHLRIELPEGSQAGGTYQLYIPEGTTTGDEIIHNIDTTNGLDITVYSGTTTLFVDPASAYANTLWNGTEMLGHRFSFEITLDTSVPLGQMSEAPFDPYLYVYNTNYEIHLEGNAPVMPNSNNISNGHTSFMDINGYPFALIFPEDWRFPYEYVDIGEAYPDLIEYIQSNRTSKQNWYMNGVESGISKRTKSDWAW